MASSCEDLTGNNVVSLGEARRKVYEITPCHFKTMPQPDLIGEREKGCAEHTKKKKKKKVQED